MSIGDKAKDVAQKVAGHAEKIVGERTNDPELTEQAHKDLSMSEDRMRTEKAKDASGS